MAESARPNILIIQSDQHSPYVSGCYGDPLVETPNLDALAASGVTFEQAYCPSPLCAPSRMSLLTGLHPYQNEVWTNEHLLSAAIPTFLHALGTVGYRPTLIGRLHSLGPDQLRGYVERQVGDHFPNYQGGRSAARGGLPGTAGPDRISLELSGPGLSAYQVKDEDVTTATVAYLDQLGDVRRRDDTTEPFAITVGYMLPHQPYVARQEDYARYDGRMTMPLHPEPFSDQLHPFFKWWRSRTGIETTDDVEVLRARTAYWALVSRLDANIGQVLDALHRNGLAENTLIVYTSDHGEQVGEHGLWWKQTFYEASVRVPLILSWPGVLPAGSRCDRVASLLDLTATLLDAAGAPPLPASPGRSLLPLATSGGTSDWEDVAFAEHVTDEGWLCRMLRQDQWKLNYYHGYRPQLFNLHDDPDELHDLAADPAYAAICEELTERVLADWNPDEIASRLELLRARYQLLIAWARRIQPPDLFRWEMLPEMNYLDDRSAVAAEPSIARA